jgi:hypothetical protein
MCGRAAELGLGPEAGAGLMVRAADHQRPHPHGWEWGWQPKRMIRIIMKPRRSRRRYTDMRSSRGQWLSLSQRSKRWSDTLFSPIPRPEPVHFASSDLVYDYFIQFNSVQSNSVELTPVHSSCMTSSLLSVPSTLPRTRLISSSLFSVHSLFFAFPFSVGSSINAGRYSVIQLFAFSPSRNCDDTAARRSWKNVFI